MHARTPIRSARIDSGENVFDLGVALDLGCRNGEFQVAWPVPVEAATIFREELFVRLVDAHDQALRAGLAGAREYLVFHPFFAREATSLYRALTSSRRLAEAGLRLLVPQTMPFWNAVLAGRAPAPPFILEILAAGLPGKGLRHYLRKWCARLQPQQAPCARSIAAQAQAAPPPEGFFRPTPRGARIHSKKAYDRAVLKHGVVCTRRDDLFSLMAAASDKRVVLGRPGEWFSASVRPLRPEETLSASLRSQLLDAVEGAFEACGESLPLFALEHLDELLCAGTGLVGAHLKRLLSRQSRLPDELWTGTFGNIWDRMLRVAVHESGGRTTGFAHSGGAEYRHDPYLQHNEYPCCQRYVTYSDALVEFHARQARPELLFGGNIPEVVRPEVDVQGVARPEPPYDSGELRRIMYVDCYLYGLDRMHAGPMVHDLLSVDWVSRLLGRMHRWGFEVLHKPHPGGRLPGIKELDARTGARLFTQSFEQVAHQADVLLYDSVTSTTLNAALKTALPIVIIDFGIWPFEPEAYELLKQRCAVVPGGTDTEGRLQVQWDDLRAGIETAREKTVNHQFYETLIQLY